MMIKRWLCRKGVSPSHKQQDCSHNDVDFNKNSQHFMLQRAHFNAKLKHTRDKINITHTPRVHWPGTFVAVVRSSRLESFVLPGAVKAAAVGLYIHSAPQRSNAWPIRKGSQILANFHANCCRHCTKCTRRNSAVSLVIKCLLRDRDWQSKDDNIISLCKLVNKHII